MKDFHEQMDDLASNVAQVIRDMPKEHQLRSIVIEAKVIGWVGNNKEVPIIEQTWGVNQSDTRTSLKAISRFAESRVPLNVLCFGVGILMVAVALQLLF